MATTEFEAQGVFDARYLAFLETVTHLRPRLHRYCSRMTGSVFDGEDLVQESLFQAYRRLDALPEDRPLAPWLFRIAHNRCIDFLRHRGVREDAESGAEIESSVLPVEPLGPALDKAVEHLVLMLPAKERACVLLKDVLDYSLEETAGFVDSTVGGVKAALNRGRSKLASLQERPRPAQSPDPQTSRLLNLYVERFNRRDWDGLRDLISADARIAVADRFRGPFAESGYFGNYQKWAVVWRLGVGQVDGVPALIRFHREADGWHPAAAIHLELQNGRIVRIRDYGHCPWLLAAADEFSGTMPP